MMFPMFVDLTGKRAIVVGRGEVAARKAEHLCRAGARVRVIAGVGTEPINSELRDLAETMDIELSVAALHPRDLDGASVVIAATSDSAEARQVSEVARAKGIPVNVVDRPDLCTFTIPAIIDRDPLIVAVSSGGTAPLLARRVRARIEAMLPANLGALARFAEMFRAAVKAVLRDGRSRRRFWDGFFEGPIAARVLAGEEARVREDMLALINRRLGDARETGLVQIVGAGPGDPDLLTLKGLRAIQEADVIVFDRLVGAGILELARRDADRLDVGKIPGNHAHSQDEINRLLCDLARAGKRVVRLKGGDPFVFGRGGEEREFLLRHGIAVEIVPGITAALGCAAAAGIPLTHRDHAQGLTLITGHGRDGEPDVDWAALAQRRQTLVIYMGAAASGRVADRLITNGLASATPCAVIADGTSSRQRIETGALADLKALVERVGGGPTLIVIGDVVRHASAWTEPDSADATPDREEPQSVCR